MLYCTVLYCTVLYCTVLYCTVLYSTALYCTVLYYTVLYLGSPIGSEDFISNFIQDKISEWVSQLERLTAVAQTQPHASYSALTHGFFSKINFLCRTTPGVDEYIYPLEDCLRMRLIPMLTGRNTVCDSVRSILSLPVRLGGLGVINPIRKAATSYTDSTYILSPIVESIVMRNQVPSYSYTLSRVIWAKERSKV